MTWWHFFPRLPAGISTSPLSHSAPSSSLVSFLVIQLVLCWMTLPKSWNITFSVQPGQQSQLSANVKKTSTEKGREKFLRVGKNVDVYKCHNVVEIMRLVPPFLYQWELAGNESWRRKTKNDILSGSKALWTFYNCFHCGRLCVVLDERQADVALKIPRELPPKCENLFHSSSAYTHNACFFSTWIWNFSFYYALNIVNVENHSDTPSHMNEQQTAKARSNLTTRNREWLWEIWKISTIASTDLPLSFACQKTVLKIFNKFQKTSAPKCSTESSSASRNSHSSSRAGEL